MYCTIVMRRLLTSAELSLDLHQPLITVLKFIKSSRTDLDDDVVDVTSFSALDVVEIKS